MRLKCPICGKEYDYESKICKECEDYAIENQLTPINITLGEKWNCAMFLDAPNSIFGRRCMDNREHATQVELFKFKVGQAPYYSWSIGSKEEKVNGLEHSYEDLTTVEALKLEELLGFDKKLNLYLVYE